MGIRHNVSPRFYLNPDNIMRIFFLFLSSAVFLSTCGCEKNPVDSKEGPKDPRQYTWSADTLAYPGSFQTGMRDIWGSSPKDVYVVGHNDRNRGLMYYFDGETWKDVALSTSQGGTIQGAIDLIAIYGFAANDIWAVGEHIYSNPNPPPNFLDSSLVIHFDGRKWTEVNRRFRQRIFGVWGTSPTNVFAVGGDGIILHFDGVKWSSQFLSPSAALGAIGGDASRYFVGGSIQAGGLDTLVAFANDGSGWKLLDKQFLGDYYSSPRFGPSDFYSPVPGVYYSVGWGIFRWQNTKWEKILSTEIFMNDIYGTGPNNIFATGQFGKAYHWNGSDWALLNLPFDKIPSDIWLTGVWTDGKEAFICGHDTGGFQTFILHGK